MSRRVVNSSSRIIGSIVSKAGLLALAAALLGCGREAPSISGVLPRTAPTLNLTPVGTIRGDEVEFGRIGSVLADSVGNIYVGDELAQEILVFDSAGRRLRTIGARGDGPGEFQGLSAMAWSGDQLAALDRRHRRVTFFDLESDTVATQNWPSAGGMPQRLYTAGREMYAAGTFARSPQEFSSAVEAARAFRAPAVRYFSFPEAEAPPSFLAIADSALGPRGFDCDGARNHTIELFSEPLFGRAAPLRAFTVHRQMAAASRVTYRIDLIDVDSGDTVRTIERDYPRRLVTDALWERATRDLRERERVSGPLDCGPDVVRPDSLPPIRSVIADESGRLWIEAATPDGFAITVVDSVGRMLGEAPLPPRDDRVPLYARNERLCLVSVDDLGVQSIHIFAVQLPDPD
jgi:hypothetical protein